MALMALVMAISAFAQGDPYAWPAYSPTISYNFKNDNPSLTIPTKDLDDCPQVVGSQDSGWWTFRWGPSKNPLITTAAITPLLARMNKDFAYFRDTMGWPPDKRAQNGYRSAIYLYGSGLCTDNASDTALGGWQSAIGAYPMVLLSYYPVFCFNPSCTYGDKVSQQGGCVHEGIHSILANLPGCKQAAWFQEGGNTWLQQQASAMQTGDYSTMGFLNGTTFLAPFMPVECYSGWLQDGSFGGPSAEGVNMYNSSGAQVCTWRNYLGGNQYGNGFPTFLGEWLGLGSVPWIWKNCPGRVLEGIAGGLGDAQIRRLITEYRAKQALIDMKEWSNAFKSLLNGYFGTSIIPEGNADGMSNWINCAAWTATPYAKTTNDGSGLLTPDQLTLPGWSGANQIPLKVTGAMASVDFQPIGTNMTCQLCYRAAADNFPVYSVPVSSGTCSLRLDKAPISNVVIAVICNTDYKYLGDTTRKAHYDYRIKLGTGMTVADINTKWFNVNLPITAELPQKKVISRTRLSKELTISFEGRQSMRIGYQLYSSGVASVSMYSPAGALMRVLSSSYKIPGHYSEKIDMSGSGISPGAYVVRLKTNDGSYLEKVTLVR
jgi:hypothetical protein